MSDRATADLFEAVIDAGAAPSVAGKPFVNIWQKLANARDVPVARLGMDARRMCELASLVQAGTISATAANRKAVHDTLHSPKKAPGAIGFLRGQVMRVSGGKADLRRAGELIEERLAKTRGE